MLCNFFFSQLSKTAIAKFKSRDCDCVFVCHELDDELCVLMTQFCRMIQQFCGWKAVKGQQQSQN